MATSSFTCIQLTIIPKHHYQISILSLENHRSIDTADQSHKVENFPHKPIQIRSCKIHAFMPLGLHTHHHLTASLSCLPFSTDNTLSLSLFHFLPSFSLLFRFFCSFFFFFSTLQFSFFCSSILTFCFFSRSPFSNPSFLALKHGGGNRVVWGPYVPHCIYIIFFYFIFDLSFFFEFFYFF